jgi:hypothetical protein
MKLCKGDRIELLWVDSVGSRDTWMDETDIDLEFMDKCMYFRSIGYYFDSTKDAILICQSVRPDDTYGGPLIGRHLCIPIVAVKKITKLK